MMLKKELFRNPLNELEHQDWHPLPSPPMHFLTPCKGCKAQLFSDELEESQQVCPLCGKHLPYAARERITRLVDEGSFEEWDAEMTSGDPIIFPGYPEKLASAQRASKENEAVIGGRAQLDGIPCALFAMDSRFMMGSMGSVVGEKITRLFERAIAEHLPVIGFTLSGGARMQEGILSLMQMAKTSGAVGRLGATGLPYFTVLCDPTAGGVTASFALLSDVTLAEPGALICFAGPRVIEQTIRQTLPEGFQSAEFLLEHGFVDAIVPREEQRQTLIDLLKLHQRRDSHASH